MDYFVFSLFDGVNKNEKAVTFVIASRYRKT